MLTGLLNAIGIDTAAQKKARETFMKYAQRAEIVHRHTPDYAELQSHVAHNVFLYNECQSGNRSQDVLRRPRFYRGLAFTAEPNFVMYKKLLGKEEFPIALEITEDQRVARSSYIGMPAQIMGEVITVRHDSIAELDKYLLNLVQFERRRVKVCIPTRTQKGTVFTPNFCEAWMYVGANDFWLPQIAGFGADRLFAPPADLLSMKDFDEEIKLGDHYRYNIKTISP